MHDNAFMSNLATSSALRKPIRYLSTWSVPVPSMIAAAGPMTLLHELALMLFCFE